MKRLIHLEVLKKIKGEEKSTIPQHIGCRKVSQRPSYETELKENTRRMFQMFLNLNTKLFLKRRKEIMKAFDKKVNKENIKVTVNIPIPQLKAWILSDAIDYAMPEKEDENISETEFCID